MTRPFAIAFGMAGKWFACSGPAGTVKVWDGEKGVEFRILKGLKDQLYSLSFSPDDTRLAAGGARGEVKIWELATGRVICTTNLKDIYISWLRFSPDGKQLAVAGGNNGPHAVALMGEVRILDAENGREVSPPLKGHTNIVMEPRFSADGKRLATGSLDGTVKVWDLTTGQETLTLKGHTGMVTSLALSPDGNRLISASVDGTVRIWDATPLPE